MKIAYQHTNRLTMVTFFLVFIITKGALTLYEGNTIEGGAARGGDTAQDLHCVSAQSATEPVADMTPEAFPGPNLRFPLDYRGRRTVCIVMKVILSNTT